MKSLYKLNFDAMPKSFDDMTDLDDVFRNNVDIYHFYNDMFSQIGRWLPFNQDAITDPLFCETFWEKV